MNEDYDKQATKFLEETNTTLKVEFLKHGLHFLDDKENDQRDIYQITLTRGERAYSFKFGNSINASVRFRFLKGVLSNECKDKLTKRGFNHVGVNTIKDLRKLQGVLFPTRKFHEVNKNFEIPTAYTILAGLGHDCPDNFANFCGDYGYDEDSIKAEKIYNAFLEESRNVKILWNDEEIKKLQEID